MADLVLDTAVCVLSCANNDPSKFQQSSVDRLRSIVKELQQEYCPAGEVIAFSVIPMYTRNDDNYVVTPL